MRNLKILVVLMSFMLFAWCSDNNWTDLNQNIETSENNKIENNVYNKIISEKGWLKDATSEELTNIILEEIKILNTPISDYLFFEQSSIKKVSIQEVQKFGWIEITRWNIYLSWIDKEYKFLNQLLSENEKLYSFSQNDSIFFYLDTNVKEFFGKIQKTYENYNIIINEKKIKDITFKNEWKEYLLHVLLPTGKSRDEIDDILDTTEKIKIEILLLK